ncbi:MAG: Hsp20/alpha crystallin family protein [Candidatus Gastranaerophilales bacterium]|nr:Hsp20/alpha crystallin family protein [Candidatus Gastranaerophilales bacterium]
MRHLMLRQPSRYMQKLQEEMNRIFDETLSDTSFLEYDGGKLEKVWRPAIEMCEQDGNYLLKAQLPGLTKNDISIDIEEDSIIIAGEFKQEEKIKDENFIKSEFKYGKFTRKLPFPQEVQSENAEAHFKDGILTIKVPKSEEEMKKHKKLEIKD